MIPTIDFETYSEAGYRFDPALGRFVALQPGKPGIKGVNTAVYGMHPSTRVICLAYDLIDGKGERLWAPGAPPPHDLLEYINNGGIVEAHNAIFEYFVWNYAADFGVKLPLSQLRCSQAKARAWGLPSSLGHIANVLDASQKKDKRGQHLIQLLSIPKKPSKKCGDLYRSFEKYPELYAEMYMYCIQDVKSEKSISVMIPDLSPFELEVWKLDQEINVRGVAIDIEGLQNCIEIYRQAEQKYTQELIDITGGAVKTVGEISKNSAGDVWAKSQGINMTSFDKATVKKVLARDGIDSFPAFKRMLEIRQTIGSASIKKLFAIERMVNEDGRLRDMFAYCGAERTGRFAGRGPQPQNLKNSGPDAKTCVTCGTMWATDLKECPKCLRPAPELTTEWDNNATVSALNVMSTRDLNTVEWLWGDAMDTIASCMRGLFVAAEGYDLIGSDYSAIEAVVLACMAEEEWRIEVFRTHGKIYEASASQASSVPLEEILAHKKDTGMHHPLRKKGKVRELAGGYGGWIGAWKNFGADKYMTDEEIKQDILSWRRGSPAITEFWGGQWRKRPGKWRFDREFYGLEGAVVMALLNPDKCFKHKCITYGYSSRDDVLYCLLPSGRKLAYHKPYLTEGKDPRGLDVYKINFWGWNSDSSKGPVGWMEMQTYGGKLCENVVQAASRDILAAAMLRVTKAGYPIVLHVHDEIIAEVLKGFGSIEEFEALMMVREPWFAHWPIKAAGGWRGREYRK